MQQPGGDQVAVEPVEGVADDGQFEMPGFRVEGLGVRRDRADVPGAQLVGLGLYHLREVGIWRLVPAVVSGLSHGERGEGVAGEFLAVGGQGDGFVRGGAQERGAGGVFELADLAGEDGVP